MLTDADAPPQTVTITLQEDGEPDQEIVVPFGANLRDELIARKINVYQSITRWTNCNGKQLCGTCIVDVVPGLTERFDVDPSSDFSAK